jgi:hypothetical protein
MSFTPLVLSLMSVWNGSHFLFSRFVLSDGHLYVVIHRCVSHLCVNTLCTPKLDSTPGKTDFLKIINGRQSCVQLVVLFVKRYLSNAFDSDEKSEQMRIMYDKMETVARGFYFTGSHLFLRKPVEQSPCVWLDRPSRSEDVGMLSNIENTRNHEGRSTL